MKEDEIDTFEELKDFVPINFIKLILEDQDYFITLTDNYLLNLY